MTCAIIHEDPQRALFKGKALHYSEQKMAAAVWRGGGLPLQMFDLREREALELALREADGLLLQGGADVAPSAYGEDPIEPQWGGDAVRDAHEIAAVEIARELGIPILGICRGAQILNVALGGSLYQDINTQIPDTLVHRDWHRYEVIEHGVAVEAGSWLEQIYGTRELLTNTIHHQSLKAIPEPLKVTARAPDGVVEAVEHISASEWIVGVQWHPEWLDGSEVGGPHRTSGTPIFKGFVEVCRTWTRAQA